MFENVVLFLGTQVHEHTYSPQATKVVKRTKTP